MTGSTLTTVSFTDPIQMILSIAATVALWKILEDRGEKGWKSLVPILSTLTFGKVANDSKHAKGRVFSGIALFSSLFLLGVVYAVGISTSNYDFQITDMNDINGVVITEQFASNPTYNGNPLVLFALLGLVIISTVFYLINHIKLCKSFDSINAGPSWMIVLWIFLPSVAYIYYAFIHKDSPPLREEDQFEDLDI